MNDTPVRYVHIYGLADPRTDEMRYVGKSTSPQRRLIEHCVRAKLHPSNHRDYWIRSLLGQGIRPVARILETVAEENWQEAERRVIAALLQAGSKLTNSTPGGEGWAAGAQHPNTHLTIDIVRDILRRVAAGDAVKQVALSVGIDRNSIYAMIRGQTWVLEELEEIRRAAEEMCTRSAPKLTPNQVLQVRELYAQGVSAVIIGKRFGVNRRTVYGATNGTSWRDLPTIPDTPAAIMARRSKGQLHGQARLTDDEVHAIRHLSAQGVKGVELSKQFNVGCAQISRIINGQRRSTS